MPHHAPGRDGDRAEHGGDEDQLLAALLHDYLEDIEGSSEREPEGFRAARGQFRGRSFRHRPLPCRREA
jgi:hypothetical protein